MAFGAEAFGAFGGAARDLFQGLGAFTTAEGKRIEAANFDMAAKFAQQNAVWAHANIAVKEAMNQRKAFGLLGAQGAAVAASGFAAGGSAMDILADSVSQAAIEKALATQQGLITELGYKEQARSYAAMAESARMAAEAADMAGWGNLIGGAFKLGTGLFFL
jgi:hypothetical protein